MSKALQWMTTKMEEQVVAKAAAAVAAGDASSSARAINKMDPAAAAGFKLFGKTIAVAATTAAACVLSDAGADAGALFGMRVAAHWATAAPSCSQVCCCCCCSLSSPTPSLDRFLLLLPFFLCSDQVFLLLLIFFGFPCGCAEKWHCHGWRRRRRAKS
jgi:hypothetical protein